MDLNEIKCGKPRMVPTWSFIGVILLVASIMIGCATESTMQIQQPFEPARLIKMHIEGCANRTDYSGKHDLEEEATCALIKRIKDSELFEIEPESNFVLTCDIQRFAEGSALKRWLMPGWGATQAEVVIMVWDKQEEKVLASFRSEATVKAGGFYTVGADQYIFGVAFDDIIQQLQTWLQGKGI